MNQYIITGLILLALIGWGSWEHSRFLSERLAYSDFRETSAIQALKQKEEHDEQISVAMAERDASISRLRDSQKRTNALRSAITPTGPEKLCYGRSAFDAALSAYLAGVENLLADGDQAVIDNKVWASAWPRREGLLSK